MVQQVNIRDELEGSTLISTENIPSSNQMASFSSDIRDVMEPQGEELPQFNSQGASNYDTPQKPSWTKTYPGGLNYKQVEALIAGVAGVIGTSEPVQQKLAEMLPQFYSDSGKVSMIGMAILVLIVAVIFYFGKQMVLK
jgi:hypothetical protein